MQDIEDSGGAGRRVIDGRRRLEGIGVDRIAGACEFISEPLGQYVGYRPAAALSGDPVFDSAIAAIAESGYLIELAVRGLCERVVLARWTPASGSLTMNFCLQLLALTAGSAEASRGLWSAGRTMCAALTARE